MTSCTRRLEIIAPLSGVLVPLASIPDPVFAEKKVGDGISLDPTTGELLAPVAGVVTQLHRAHHAIVITTKEGIEVLLHIGIDTVSLKGEGFIPLVRQGQHVTLGQTLISFDVDRVACKARSLLTQILIANSDEVSRLVPASGQVSAGKSTVLTVELPPPKPLAAKTGDATLSGQAVTLPNPAGLHARPAAVLAAEAKKFMADIRLVRDSAEANAKSIVAIMGLATQYQDLLTVKASGPDAEAAVTALTALLAAGCGEDPGEVPPPPVITEQRAIATSPDDLVGVSASPKLAIGRVAQYRQQIIEVPETGDSPDSERSRLNAALHEACAQIEKLKRRLSDPAKANILVAQQELLDDPELISQAIEGVGHGQSAGFAWRAAFCQQAGRLEALKGPGNALLRERGNDIRDVGQRVLALLAGVKLSSIKVPSGSILIAEDLTPSDTASLDRSKVLGFCTTRGGATSHVAILARSLGIPAVCGIDPNVLTLEEGQLVVLDGSRGLLHRNPSPAEIDDAEQCVARQTLRDDQEKMVAGAPAVTSDGHHIEVLANVRNAHEALEGIANGAAGVGLLRSEFLFDERDSAPDEDEQAEAYSAVAKALGHDRTLIVRTLDVGGDKPLPYLPLPHEDNPFLGLRGVRVSLERPELFRTQLRAILRVAPLVRLHIMLPMIATIEEWREAKAILREEQAATGQSEVRLGMMIEVPSAALMAEQFAREADFFSIGTNDLTQYTLAMDRGHPKLAQKADGLHPSVLRMIALSCEGARKHGKWVGVCGGMASEAVAVPLLIGLGVNELSLSVPAIPAIKALIRRLSLSDCRRLAQEALQMSSAGEVRALLAEFSD
jgi:phosphoenolpyruvate-protein phosphotransferase